MIVCTNLKALIGVQGDAAFVRVLLSKCPVVSDILRVVSETSVVLIADSSVRSASSASSARTYNSTSSASSASSAVEPVARRTSLGRSIL